MKVVPYSLAHVTHELSNPLAGMQCTVHFLEWQLAKPKDLDLGALRRDVGTLKSEITRLRALLEDMREFVRSGRLTLKPVSIGEVAAEIAAVEQHHHRERGIRTELDFPPSLPRVVADREKLKQVVLNLSKNARCWLAFTVCGHIPYLRHSWRLIAFAVL